MPVTESNEQMTISAQFAIRSVALISRPKSLRWKATGRLLWRRNPLAAEREHKSWKEATHVTQMVKQRAEPVDALVSKNCNGYLEIEEQISYP